MEPLDVALAMHDLRPVPRRAVVAMDPPCGSLGSILLTDVLTGNLRSDTGTVLAVGDGVDLMPGTRVVVRGYDGVWIENFRTKRFRTDRQVRVIGIACEHQGEPVEVVWWDSILARWDMDGELRATGRNILIRRDPMAESIGGILLPDEVKFRSGYATVLSVGELERDVKAGDRVYYTGLGLLDVVLPEDKDLAFCTIEALGFVEVA